MEKIIPLPQDLLVESNKQAPLALIQAFLEPTKLLLMQIRMECMEMVQR